MLYADIKIVTKEVYTNNTKTATNWTCRAGTFLEQSRAFLDSYLGRWDNLNDDAQDEEIIEENAEECTSGATSGEDIWGTPTSGENDEIQMFNSDQTQSVIYTFNFAHKVYFFLFKKHNCFSLENQSPTKSYSSSTGDEDTELMMDELLMAPPMTASTIRGLLPRYVYISPT